MKNKKLIIAIIAVALVVAAAITFNSTYKPYETDPGDTEELYRENVANAGYANTIETAMPQTEIYNAVNEHFNSELPETGEWANFDFFFFFF